MKILPITPYNVNLSTQNKQDKIHQNNIHNNTYNPIYYKDLAFTARLFRTPENFYAQPFNKAGMPDTMKEYLNADYEDRQKMPPAQMLKLVFDDINETKNLEQVKRIFPNEKLFENLTDVPNKKSRTGILAEIDLMKEDDKTLFKNGKDNLGHYILKKIYTEAKTLKEINEDFKRDVSVHYNGLSPIEYDTLRAYGIKFPNNSFWKSLTATREEFPYEYKPRKPIESRKTSPTQTQNNSRVPSQRNRFEGVKDWEIDKLSDALVRGKGSTRETMKQLKNTSLRDEASLNFVAKYMGEINSVVLEKLHVSPEMRMFFEESDNLSKTQKQKLDAYWQEPERRELRSIIMKDTIKLFFDAYGVDGQNDEFRELVEYAHGIKPARIAQMEEHNRIQAEYDEMFAQLDAQEEKPEPEPVQEPPRTFEEELELSKKEFNVDDYRFEIDGQQVVMISNIREALQENLQKETLFMPKNIANRFIKFVLNDEQIPDSYILSKLLQDNGFNLPEDERLMSDDDTLKFKFGLYQKFSNANPIECRAGQQAVIDCILKFYPSEPTPQLLTLGLFEYIAVMKRMTPHAVDLIIKNNKFTNEKYAEYKKPLSDNEVRKISMQAFELLRNYTVDKTVLDNASPFAGLENGFYSLACYLRNQNPNDFKRSFTNYIKEYGGSARYILDKNVSPEMKYAKLEQMLVNYAVDHNREFSLFISSDPVGLNFIKYHRPDMYNKLTCG